MNALGYAFQEALLSIRRQGRSAAMSVGTIAIAFLTLGGFVLVSANLQAVADQWSAAAEMSVYLRDDLDPAMRQSLVDELSGHTAVVGVEYVSKQDALERFKSGFPELADVAASTDNPFPPSIEVQLRTETGSTGEAAALARELAGRDGVVDVRYDQQWLERLQTIATTLRVAGAIVAGVLVLGAAFTVMAVVRLSLQARHDEIEIMQLVGAPYAIMRGPFMAEGALLGGMGAAASLVALWLLFATTETQIAALAVEWGQLRGVEFLRIVDVVSLLAAGVLVGALAGGVAARAVR